VAVLDLNFWKEGGGGAAKILVTNNLHLGLNKN